MFTTDTFVIAPGWERLLQACRLDSVEALYALPEGVTLKHGSSTQLCRLDLPDAEPPRTLFIKKYWYPTLRKCISGASRGTLFGIPKVQREYQNLNNLRNWGLDAPAPVAYGLERVGGWLRRSVLVSDGVPEACSLDLFIRDHLPTLIGPTQQATRGELIAQLANYTARMHAHRFVHHDFFWRNILLTSHSLSRFFVIDSHKGRCWRNSAQRNRAKDLATLDAPAPTYFRRTERLRFFLRYVAHARLTAADKTLLRLTLRMAAPLREDQVARVRSA